MLVMIIHTVDLKNVRYSYLIALLEKTKGTLKNYIFILEGTTYELTALEYTHDAEGGQYRFTFHTEHDPIFKDVYIDKELDRQRHNDWPHFYLGPERPTRELHLTALDKILLNNNISYE